MHTKSPLYLASSSRGRHLLLVQSRIPFIVISQTADETVFGTKLPIQELTTAIARAKMEHAVIPQDHLNQSNLGFSRPASSEGAECFVLTADTLCMDNDGEIYGKPLDWEDARRMLIKWRSGSTAATAFCLDKKIYSAGQWHTQERIERCVTARLHIDIPDEWINEYMVQTSCLQISGAVCVGGFGALFVSAIEGSYSTIIGLPLFELREALTKLGFFILPS